MWRSAKQVRAASSRMTRLLNSTRRDARASITTERRTSESERFHRNPHSIPIKVQCAREAKTTFFALWAHISMCVYACVPTYKNAHNIFFVSYTIRVKLNRSYEEHRYVCISVWPRTGVARPHRIMATTCLRVSPNLHPGTGLDRDDLNLSISVTRAVHSNFRFCGPGGHEPHRWFGQSEAAAPVAAISDALTFLIGF